MAGHPGLTRRATPRNRLAVKRAAVYPVRMTESAPHHDPRADERIAWTRATLADDNAMPVRASMDAGFRSYWRTQAAAWADGRG